MGTPAWLGIGAQRSGTTWLTDLLTQHPGVGLGNNGKKEQHLLHKLGDGRIEEAEYLDLFPADGVRRGDWTPQYLRHASTPAAAALWAPRRLPTTWKTVMPASLRRSVNNPGSPADVAT